MVQIYNMMTHNHIDADIFHKILVIDIETVPVSPDLEQLNPVYQQHWQKKYDQISKYMEDTPNVRDTFFERGGIYAEFGKIICISIGRIVIENNQASIKVKSYAADDEKQLLQSFFQDLKTFQEHWSEIRLAGHNIKEFDLPYICRRALILGLPIPEALNMQGFKPWQVPHIDSLELWRFGDFKHYISLDLLAHILGVPSSKTDIDGSQVAEQYWVHHDLPRIVRYCENDVVTTTKVIAKLKNWALTFD